MRYIDVKLRHNKKAWFSFFDFVAKYTIIHFMVYHLFKILYTYIIEKKLYAIAYYKRNISAVLKMSEHNHPNCLNFCHKLNHYINNYTF